jgi:hypothetical protein
MAKISIIILFGLAMLATILLAQSQPAGGNVSSIAEIW